MNRRNFLSITFGATVAIAIPARRIRAAVSRRGGGPHPTPRPGITAAKVMTAAQLGKRTELIPVFDAVRAVPEIIDGIRCNCPCGGEPGYYSLLTCYEAPGAMARDCDVCQGQGRLATRLAKEGKTLAQIRVAIDAKFG